MKWRNREMKNFMKLGAVVLAIVMVLSMSVTAFAASPAIGAAGTVGDTNNTLGLVTAANTVTFNNNLKAYNPDTTAVSIYAPNITYTFDIQPTTVSSAVTITDSSGVKANVKPGVGTPTISGPITYTKDGQISAISTGADNSQLVTVTFPANTFSNQGVYRYTITRTASGSAVTNGTVTLDSQGLSTAVNTVYLDVYVLESSSGAAIYAYALHNISSDITNGTADTPKLSGFEDTYYTDNVTIAKTVVNDALAGDFDFAVTFGGTGTKDTDYALVNTSSGTPTITSQTALKIANGESVTYKGVPYGVAMTITETNNIVGTTYESAVSGDVDSTVSNKVIAPTVSSNPATVTNSALTTASDKTVAFTNTLQLISPTGVVLRVAPYALMLGVGLFLVLFMRRRKSRAEA